MSAFELNLMRRRRGISIGATCSCGKTVTCEIFTADARTAAWPEDIVCGSTVSGRGASIVAALFGGA